MRISDWSSDVCSSDLDGQRTLAQLIAADARARLIAPLLWQRFATRLHEVPADGEVFPLVEIGAHCRGSLFLDASTLTSAKLSRRSEERRVGKACGRQCRSRGWADP